MVLLIVDEISFLNRATYVPPHAFALTASTSWIFRRGVLDPANFHFGDISIILVGDFGQLEPIEDISFCDDETNCAR